MADNSSRIEAATRPFVGATLSGDEIAHLVRKAFPDWKGGIYPSDCAYQKLPNGTFAPRGKQAYGDGVLLYMGSDSFKVLPTEAIVRRERQTGRGTTAPRSESEIAASLAKKAASLASAPAVAKVDGKVSKSTPATA